MCKGALHRRPTIDQQGCSPRLEPDVAAVSQTTNLVTRKPDESYLVPAEVGENGDGKTEVQKMSLETRSWDKSPEQLFLKSTNQLEKQFLYRKEIHVSVLSN